MQYHTWPVFKTTVYLPDALRRRIKELARRQGTSEAELIRHALERAVDEPGVRPTLPLFSSDDPTLAERVDDVLARSGR